MPNPYVYPRPEYPRPDFQRATLEGHDWLNLNGPWQFRFDGDRVGEQEGWFKLDDLPWREQIIVPFCWESLAAWGEGDAAGNQNYYATRVFRNPLEVTRENHRHAPRYEVGWYRRHIEIPDSAPWKDKRLILTVGAADFFTDCWCNGVHLGHHEGGYLPFQFDVTDALQTGPDGVRRGLIVFRVEDPMDNKEQPVGKQWKWYTTTSGIWQTVYLEPRPASYLEHIQIITDIEDGTARFRVETRNAPPNSAVEIEITPPEGNPQTLSLSLADNQGERQIKIKPLCLWNPNNPWLYRLKLSLKSGDQIIDFVRSYFGMRKIGTSPSHDANSPDVLSLNGVPRYMRGVLHQAYYPGGVYTPGDVEVFKNDIGYAKKVGFTFLRIHIKIEDPLLLYYADTMGMLLMCDFPNFGEGGDTPLGRRRYEEMMRKAIRRDFNHPSIFAWCLFNETWGFGGQVEFVKLFGPKDDSIDQSKAAGVSAMVASGNQESKELILTEVKDAAEAAVAKLKLSNHSSHVFVQQMWELAKTLDTTRLIEDMSVVHWEHLDYYAHGDTDINSWHFYMHDYDHAKEHIAKVVNSTYPGSTFNYVEGFKQRAQPLINSEYGGIGALDGDRDVSWSFKFLTNELRRHGQISGYIFTQLHDVEWEYNGFLNYDRTPKEFGYHPRIINESNTLPINAPPVSRHPPGTLVEVEVASSHFSSAKHENVVLQWRLAGIDSLGKIHQDIVKGSTPIPYPHRRVAHAHTIPVCLPDVIMVCTLSVEALQADTGESVAQNFINFFVSDHYPIPFEQTDRNSIFRAHPADWQRAEWSIYLGDKDQNRAEDITFGYGHGFFEWEIDLRSSDIRRARRVRVLCEASSRRIDSPQTDDDHLPTAMQISLNGLTVFDATLPNHPHDARGVLSYLRGGKGAYGYLANISIEKEELHALAERTQDRIILRCGVSPESLAQNGLSIYGAECGRYPICPTLIIDW